MPRSSMAHIVTACTADLGGARRHGAETESQAAPMYPVRPQGGPEKTGAQESSAGPRTATGEARRKPRDHLGPNFTGRGWGEAMSQWRPCPALGCDLPISVLRAGGKPEQLPRGVPWGCCAQRQGCGKAQDSTGI